MNLGEHLAGRPADTEVTFRGIELGGGGAQIFLNAPLWGERTSADFVVRAEKVFEFSFGAAAATISSADCSCSASHPLLLDYGPRASIFGQAPLPDPYRFFLEFQKLIRDQFGIPREPLRYLNWQGRMVPWLGMVYSRSFNLLTAAKPVAEAAGELLAAQVAEYIILDEKPLPEGEGAEAFILGDAWLVGKGISLSLPIQAPRS